MSYAVTCAKISLRLPYSTYLRPCRSANDELHFFLDFGVIFVYAHPEHGQLEQLGRDVHVYLGVEIAVIDLRKFKRV